MKIMAWLLVSGLCVTLLLASSGDTEQKVQKSDKGSLESPGLPSDPVSAMFTLESIYLRLISGETGSKRDTAFVEPTVTQGTPTGHSYNDIMAVAPVKDDIHAALPLDVAAGKVFWGLNGTYWGLQTGTGSISSTCAKAIVPQTGQRTSFQTSDDGDLQSGFPWPNPRFSDNHNGTVTDNLTNLVWLKNANCTGSLNWQSSLAFCNSLAHGQCGLTDGSGAGDWRLPNVRELQSLIDYEYFDPGLCNAAGTGQWSEGDAFTSVLNNYYWSSTTYADSGRTSEAWYIPIGDYGGSISWDIYSTSYFVWPVRDRQ